MNKHRASIGLLSINNFCLNLGRQAHVPGTRSSLFLFGSLELKVDQQGGDQTT